MKGRLFVISGPSGCGKSTISSMLLKKAQHLKLSVSATTRKPRENEIEGEHYYFLTKDNFEKDVYKRQAIDILKPVLKGAETEKAGKIVLGTVKGDLHDIGKNIFKNMAEIAGFEVYDIGIDQPASAFVEKIKEVNPDIIGMSGVLTLALDSMKDTVEAIKSAGLRDNVKVIIGGNPVTKEACEAIQADAFTTNAAEGVKICKEWVAK